jgi:succinate-acetate transporter protein
VSAADPSVRRDTRVVLRPLASPLPLGFLAVGTAALLTAGFDLGWIAKADQHQVGLLLLTVAPGPLLSAAVFGFLTRDPIAATGMGILTAGWAARGLILLTAPPGAHSEALGTVTLAIGGAVAISALEAAAGKLAPAATMALTSVTFVLTGLAELSSSRAVSHASGIVSLALVGAAFYSAAALALEDLQRRTVLPVGRRGAGERALVDDLDIQLEGVAGEAGVRRQL